MNTQTQRPRSLVQRRGGGIPAVHSNAKVASLQAGNLNSGEEQARIRTERKTRTSKLLKEGDRVEAARTVGSLVVREPKRAVI